MGIYANGMEMPKRCSACRFAGYGGRLCELHVCMFTGESQPTLSPDRMDNCPLIPVPPHGRLIDADEFLKRAIGTKCFRGDYALMLEELIGESPTIVPAEEGET